MNNKELKSLIKFMKGLGYRALYLRKSNRIIFESKQVEMPEKLMKKHPELLDAPIKFLDIEELTRDTEPIDYSLNIRRNAAIEAKNIETANKYMEMHPVGNPNCNSAHIPYFHIPRVSEIDKFTDLLYSRSNGLVANKKSLANYIPCTPPNEGRYAYLVPMIDPDNTLAHIAFTELEDAYEYCTQGPVDDIRFTKNFSKYTLAFYMKKPEITEDTDEHEDK